MSGHDNLWVGNLMPGLRKTIEQIVCDYELYAINKNCLFDIIPQNVLSFSWPMHQVSPQQPTFLMPGIIRIIVSVQYPHSYRLFFSAAGMAALFFPRGGLEEGETLKHKQARILLRFTISPFCAIFYRCMLSDLKWELQRRN